MSTSATSTCSKASAPEKISGPEFTYACTRNYHQAHNLLLTEIKKSGLSQKKIASLTGIDEAALSRLLRRPRNMQLDTISKILLATTGATLKLAPTYPNSLGHRFFHAHQPIESKTNVKSLPSTLNFGFSSNGLETKSTTDGKVVELINA